MNWQKLDKNSLEELRNECSQNLIYEDKKVLIYDDKHENRDFGPFAIVSYIEIGECGVDMILLESPWIVNYFDITRGSLIFSDETLLEYFSHFLIINQPERSKRENTEK